MTAVEFLYAHSRQICSEDIEKAYASASFMMQLEREIYGEEKRPGQADLVAVSFLTGWVILIDQTDWLIVTIEKHREPPQEAKP